MGLFGRKKDNGPILREQVAELHWDIDDPFLFVSHHFDKYPVGNERQAPPYEDVRRKDIGQDYYKLFGYRMYTGKVSPGFVHHPHWGYETITLVSKGYVDHFDSLGNQGRYGYGDVQWVSAGSRYHHCEMYPLVHQDRENPQLVTQIMLNLPLKDKNSPVEVTTIWKEDLCTVEKDGCLVTILAGEFEGTRATVPNKVSWAADPAHHVRIMKVDMPTGATFTLAPTEAASRNIYITEGKATVCEKEFQEGTRLKLKPECEVTVTMGEVASELWVLEGDPIGEKQTMWGPVVLGSTAEVRKANDEIRSKEMENWPWEFTNQKQPLGTERFYRSADGTESRPRMKNDGE
ncbi:MAG: pirin family protein [archaeon]|nr:pirin family protein [archaeon]